MRLALYQPDIPQNAGALVRLAACLDVGIDMIEPCGFRFHDAGFRRAGLDYIEQTTIVRHASWDHFQAAREGRVVLLTTKASRLYTAFRFDHADILLLGRESAGVPQAVHEAADASVRVPLREGARSLNVALAAAMVLGEALRQTNGFPA